MTYVIPKFDGEYAFLSNFYPSPITVEPKNVSKITFPTGEHMFQALKYKAIEDSGSAEDYIKLVNANPDPNHAKRAGKRVLIDVAKWDSIKIEMMRQTVWEKFKQHPDLLQRLLDTGPAMLVEGNTWGDKFWGRVDGQGYNMLGCILIEVRGAYRWNGATQTWNT